MKVFIQIPCLNEEKTLPLVLKSIPKKIPGFTAVEILVIDDGSTDKTVEVAKKLGVNILFVIVEIKVFQNLSLMVSTTHYPMVPTLLLIQMATINTPKPTFLSY